MSQFAIATAFLVLTLGFVAFLLFAHIYSLVQCAKNQNLTGVSKVIWVILIVCAGIVGIPLYGIIHGETKFHRGIAYGFGFMVLVVTISMGLMSYYKRTDTLQAFQAQQARQLPFEPSVDFLNSSTFTSSLPILKNELSETSFYQFDQIGVYSEFNELLNDMLQDQVIDSAEAKNWIDLYNSRSELPNQAYRVKFMMARKKTEEKK